MQLTVSSFKLDITVELSKVYLTRFISYNFCQLHFIVYSFVFQVMMVKKMQESDTENEIREAYRVFDKERTGMIEASEMRLILSNLPEKLSDAEIDEMLTTADKDGNGAFSYDEFRLMIGATMHMNPMKQLDFDKTSFHNKTNI